MKSAILGVGTELTDGQILNRNAAWLSARLKVRGARTTVHLTIPDDRPLILQGLEICAREADLIFVTGGLGPTSDDFTRDLIAEWSGKSLEFHEPSWQAVQERLSARGFAVQEFQRQQCYFPAGAMVLPNSQGTANGFRLEAHGKKIVVLPGPPREIEAIWHDHLENWINEICRELDPIQTHSWDLIGVGESQVATLAEPIVKDSPWEVGYRVHLPYVEFKLSHARSQTEKVTPVLAALEKALGPWTMARDGQDVAEELAKLLANLGVAKEAAGVDILDEVTGSYLLQRMVTPFRHLWGQKFWQVRSQGAADPKARLELWLKPLDEHRIRVGYRRDRQSREIEVEAPMRSSLMSERRKQYFAEIALAWWSKELST